MVFGINQKCILPLAQGYKKWDFFMNKKFVIGSITED